MVERAQEMASEDCGGRVVEAKQTLVSQKKEVDVFSLLTGG